MWRHDPIGPLNVSAIFSDNLPDKFGRKIPIKTRDVARRRMTRDGTDLTTHTRLYGSWTNVGLIESFSIAFLVLRCAIRSSIAYAKKDLLGPILVIRYVAEPTFRMIFFSEFTRAVEIHVPIAPQCSWKETLKMITFLIIWFQILPSRSCLVKGAFLRGTEFTSSSSYPNSITELPLIVPWKRHRLSMLSREEIRDLLMSSA